jgi:uncharacterized membrane protein YeaQ/YmgE (transglycosylase-associated protein family)
LISFQVRAILGQSIVFKIVLRFARRVGLFFLTCLMFPLVFSATIITTVQLLFSIDFLKNYLNIKSSYLSINLKDELSFFCNLAGTLCVIVSGCIFMLCIYLYTTSYLQIIKINLNSNLDRDSKYFKIIKSIGYSFVLNLLSMLISIIGSVVPYNINILRSLSFSLLGLFYEPNPWVILDDFSSLIIQQNINGIFCSLVILFAYLFLLKNIYNSIDNIYLFTNKNTLKYIFKFNENIKIAILTILTFNLLIIINTSRLLIDWSASSNDRENTLITYLGLSSTIFTLVILAIYLYFNFRYSWIDSKSDGRHLEKIKLLKYGFRSNLMGILIAFIGAAILFLIRLKYIAIFKNDSHHNLPSLWQYINPLELLIIQINLCAIASHFLGITNSFSLFLKEMKNAIAN